jgi:hypothetical protein
MKGIQVCLNKGTDDYMTQVSDVAFGPNTTYLTCLKTLFFKLQCIVVLEQ